MSIAMELTIERDGGDFNLRFGEVDADRFSLRMCQVLLSNLVEAIEKDLEVPAADEAAK